MFLADLTEIRIEVMEHTTDSATIEGDDMFPICWHTLGSKEGLYCLACVLFPTNGEHLGVSRAQY